MNKALISIGTNSDRELNLSRCHTLLNNSFPDILYSGTCLTTPYGESYIKDFLNQLALVNTEKNMEEISSLLKSFEKEIGRKSSDKEKGIVKIDIDLVVWNELILKPADITRNYITNLLPDLKE